MHQYLQRGELPENNRIAAAPSVMVEKKAQQRFADEVIATQR